MKYIYMPQSSTGLVGFSYIGALLRPLMLVTFISVSHNRATNKVEIKSSILFVSLSKATAVLVAINYITFHCHRLQQASQAANTSTKHPS
jgi:hypothetical protein